MCIIISDVPIKTFGFIIIINTVHCNVITSLWINIIEFCVYNLKTYSYMHRSVKIPSNGYDKSLFLLKLILK